MPRAKVSLSKLLALGVELDGGIVTAQFLVLLTHSDVGHDHNCDEVVKLEAKIFQLPLVLIGRGLRALCLHLLSDLRAPIFGKLERFLGE